MDVQPVEKKERTVDSATAARDSAAIAQEDEALKAESLILTPPPLPEVRRPSGDPEAPDRVDPLNAAAAIPSELPESIRAEDRLFKSESVIATAKSDARNAAEAEDATPAIPTELPSSIQAEDRRIKAEASGGQSPR